MRTFKNSLYLLALLLWSLSLNSGPAEAQLVLVDDPFRIVEVDKSKNRIGIAKPGAKPNVRQNWVYLDLDTRASYRTYIPSARAYRDRVITGKQILDVAAGNIGQIMRVKGGRDWDGSIKAKAIHFKI